MVVCSADRRQTETLVGPLPKTTNKPTRTLTAPLFSPCSLWFPCSSSTCIASSDPPGLPPSANANANASGAAPYSHVSAPSPSRAALRWDNGHVLPHAPFHQYLTLVDFSFGLELELCDGLSARLPPHPPPPDPDPDPAAAPDNNDSGKHRSDTNWH